MGLLSAYILKIFSAVMILNTLVFRCKNVILRSVYDPSLKELDNVEKSVVNRSGCKLPYTFDSNNEVEVQLCS